MASPRVERRILHAIAIAIAIAIAGAGGHRVGDLHGMFKDWATELGSTHEVLHRTLR